MQPNTHSLTSFAWHKIWKLIAKLQKRNTKPKRPAEKDQQGKILSDSFIVSGAKTIFSDLYFMMLLGKVAEWGPRHLIMVWTLFFPSNKTVFNQRTKFTTLSRRLSKLSHLAIANRGVLLVSSRCKNLTRWWMASRRAESCVQGGQSSMFQNWSAVSLRVYSRLGDPS